MQTCSVNKEILHAVNIMFSIIVPTRNRTEQLRLFLNSFIDTTDNPDNLEIILVIDDDDMDTVNFHFDGLAIKKVTVKPGLAMGALNMEGFRASRGEYIMLLNDDVIVRTQGWDTRLLKEFKCFPDGVALIHVNDGIFKEKLCTFPLVSRVYTDYASGICPEHYTRYRIDDHIYNVFNLLALAGHRRIVYLPDVVFEHNNYEHEIAGIRVYKPDRNIHESDTRLYEEYFQGRKKLAVKLLEHIESNRHQNIFIDRGRILDQEKDPLTMRDPAHVRISPDSEKLSTKNTRTTIGVVCANIDSTHTKQCISNIKKYTNNYDLVILDNNYSRYFNHPHEMNKLIAVTDNEYLVLMDDDVFVEPGWLDGMFRCINSSVGVVTPLHSDINGNLSYAGIYMHPDYSGYHEHLLERPDAPRPVMTLCSAMVLIDMSKCGHIRFDECYSKYFLDIDYGLRIWESGFEVVCSPYTMVTHVGGATLAYGTDKSNRLFDIQRKRYIENWIDSKRYHALEKNTWDSIQEIKSLLRKESDISDRLEILEEGYKGYNIIFHNGEFLGISQAYRVLKISRLENNEYYRLVKGDSIDQLKESIDKLVFPGLLMFLKRILYTVKRWCRRILYFFNNKIYKFIYPVIHKVKLIIFVTIRKTAGRLYPYLSSFIHLARRKKADITHVLTRIFVYMRKKVNSLVYLVRRISYPITARTAFSEKERSGGNHTSPVEQDKEIICVRQPPGEVVKLDKIIGGYSVYRYENRFYACPGESRITSYDQLGKAINCRFAAHTLPELLRHVKSEELRQGNISEHKRLLFGNLPPSRFNPMVEHLICPGDSLIVGKGKKHGWCTDNIIELESDSIRSICRKTPDSAISEINKYTGGSTFDQVVIPSLFPDTWDDNLLEALAAGISDNILVVNSNGLCKSYIGEDAHRLVYNKGFLSNMFKILPPPLSCHILEVGCSDGMVCEMLAQLGAGRVVGIDTMETAGFSAEQENVLCMKMDANDMDFPENSFDYVMSIATFEHLSGPVRVLENMLRVTRTGGYVYVQAGPLYYSPYGHHMFAYFQNYPWIHLRKSKEEIVIYMRQHGIDKQVHRDLAMEADEYINGTLSTEHLNGLFLDQYRLDEFIKRDDIHVLKYKVSYEGRDMLTGEIKDELSEYDEETLVQHGFELAFRKVG